MPQSIPKAVLQINNARQILALVKERPCVNKGGTTSQRGTVIAYAELTTVEKLLNDAVKALVPTVPVKFEGGVDDNGNFVRPMGATPKDPHSLTEIRRNELFRCSCGSEFRTMNDAVTHAANARQEER